MSTDYHAQYWAHELTRRRASDEPDKSSSTFYNATVDLNPHQIDAALFAFRNPLSRGAILADEVGLGKTIEAGLVISQLWAERNQKYFEQEIEKLDAWAEDLKENLERELKELDREIRATKKEARQMMDLDEKVALHKKAKETERKRNDKRRALFEQQDAVDKQKDTLITRVEAQLAQKVEMKRLFEMKWRVV
jgi:SNF2 family DNA or RNA helicase